MIDVAVIGRKPLTVRELALGAGQVLRELTGVAAEVAVEVRGLMNGRQTPLDPGGVIQGGAETRALSVSGFDGSVLMTTLIEGSEEKGWYGLEPGSYELSFSVSAGGDPLDYVLAVAAAVFCGRYFDAPVVDTSGFWFGDPEEAAEPEYSADQWTRKLRLTEAGADLERACTEVLARAEGEKETD